MADHAAMQPLERRREGRVDVDGGSLHVDAGDGRAPIECSLCNVSMNGAALKLSADLELPPEVTILIGRVTRRARVAWRRWGQIGVEFLGEPEFPKE